MSKLARKTRPGAAQAACGGTCADDAFERIDEACRLVIAGKLAVRGLAAWVRPFGVTDAGFRLLWLLAQSGADNENSAIDQAELAERLAVSAAQVSAVVERLRGAKLVQGVRDSEDRRRQLWRLAAAGVGLIDAVVTSVAASRIPPLAPPFQGGELAVENAA